MADKEIWGVDLDTEEYKAKAKEAMELIEKLDKVGELKQTIAGLGEAAAVGGVMAAAVLGIVASINILEEAEGIRAVKQQFDLMAKSAGLAAEQIEHGLVKAVDGLADDDDLLAAASKGISALGANAAKLPEVMELARKSTALYGGDLISNFERMNQAIASGQTRALKQMGIIVDSEKAYKDYARSIGVAVGALSESGKQAAVMNAVLEKGKTAFAGIDPNIRETQNTLTQIKVTFKEIGEAFTLVFDKYLRPGVTWWLENIKKAATATKEWLGAGGEETGLQKNLEANSGLIKKLQADIEAAKQRLAMPAGEQGFFDKLIHGTVDAKTTENQIKQMEQRLQMLMQKRTQYEAELNGLNSKKKEGEGGAGEGGEAGGQSSVDKQKELQLTLQFNNDLLKIKQQRIEAERKLTNDLSQLTLRDNANQIAVAQRDSQGRLMLTQNEYQEKEVLEQQHQNALAQIQQNVNLSTAQKAQMALETEANHKAQMKQWEDDLLEKRVQTWDAYQRKANSVGDGIARAFKANSIKNQAQLADFGKMGQMTFDTFQSHATDSLMALGEGTESATDVMKGFFFGMLSDMAANYGKFILSASIFPPNPAGLAAGAALLILAGVLKSAAGGKGSSGSTAAGSSASQGQSQVISAKSNAVSAEYDIAEKNKDEGKLRDLTAEKVELEKEDFDNKKQQTMEDKGLTDQQKTSIIQDLERLYNANVTRLNTELSDTIKSIHDAADDMADAAKTNLVDRKSVSISFAGDYLETDQTKQMLTDLVRQAADATDFTINQVGQR
jgi:hypothetical protein